MKKDVIATVDKLEDSGKKHLKLKKIKFGKKTKKLLSILSFAVFLTCVICVSVYLVVMPKTRFTDIDVKYNSFEATVRENEYSSGYQLQVSASKGMKEEQKLLAGKENEFEVKGLASGMPYYTRSRSFKYIAGVKIYSPWSNTVIITTLEKPKLVNIFAMPSAEKVFLNNTISISTFPTPLNARTDDLKYTSSDEKIAVVSQDGTVKGVGVGDAVITISSESSGVSTEVSIRVEKPFVEQKGIKITDKPGKSVEAGDTIQLHAEIIPNDATNQEIVWSIKDSTRAKISSKGVVTTLRPTEYLEVTASTKDGKFSAKYILTVKKTTGYITKSMLDKLNLSSIDNLMIVAHPDDESLWGGSHLMNARYFVVVLTNSYKSQRASELKEAMALSNDKYIILSYPDLRDRSYEDGKYKFSVDQWSTVDSAVSQDIETLLAYKNWKVVATHNPNGEYGHLHHRIISKKVTSSIGNNISNGCEFYYFGNWYSKKEKNPDSPLDDVNMKKKSNMVDVYIPSSPYAIENNRHMVGYEKWIKYQNWNNEKSR